MELINFQDPIQKNNFNIYHTVTIFNFPQTPAENQYIPGRS